MGQHIIIGGYYGGNNIGDEAILRATLDTFQSLRKDLEFTVVSHSPELTEKQHGVRAVHWREIPTLAKTVLQADLVLVGGGGLFMDHWGIDEDSYFRITHGGISTYGTLAFLADAFNVPYMLYGVGVGPLHSEVARKHTRRIFCRARLATLRDADSLSLLEEIGLKPLPKHIQLTADAAFALESSTEAQIETLGIDPKIPLLGISVRYWDQPEPPQKWIPSLAKDIRTFLSHIQADILLLPFQIDNEGKTTDDLQICHSLAQEINLPGRTHTLRHVLSVHEMQALLGKCDLILGMRLHALLMGINKHVPIVGLAYDPKVTALMKQAGFEQLICPLPARPSELLRVLMLAWQGRVDFSKQAKSYHERVKPQARKNMKLALQLLDYPAPKLSDNQLSKFLVQRLAQMQKVDMALQEEKARSQSMFHERNEAQCQTALLRQRLHEVENSRTYRMALILQRIRNTIVPPGGRREWWLRTLGHLMRNESQD